MTEICLPSISSLHTLERPIQGTTMAETFYSFPKETTSLQEICCPKNKIATVNYLQIQHRLKMLTQHFYETLASNISVTIHHTCL